MNRKISHKVGVKILTESQLENVLPTYENFFHKVDVCRQAAQLELMDRGKRHYQYNFMYDNVLSFLGKRGTGKTSVAFTLRKMIKEKYEKEHCDVVLPLIIPEVIPNNCTVLGWILAIVEEQIKELEEQIYKLEKREDGEGCWSKCRYSDMSENGKNLKYKLDELCQFFYAGNYDPSNESSYYKAVDYSVRQAMDYYNFGKGIAEIWDGWIDRILHLHKLKEEKSEGNKENKMKPICPMIYFIFDDVDLAPDKIEELLSVIIKYLSHPNIMVLTTADESLFLEVIEKSLDKKIGRLPGEWRHYLMQPPQTSYVPWRNNDVEEEVEQEDLVYKTARMYLGKVLPTSTRYYLCMFNTAKQKENFCLEDNINLGKAVHAEIQRIVSCCYGRRINNFMQSNDRVVNFYLKFFGNTSRQIGNVYIALQEMIETLVNISCRVQKETIDEDKAIQKIYQNVRNFLSIAITANHDLAKIVEQVDSFVDEIYLLEYNQWKLYINYVYLNDFLAKKFPDNNSNKQKNVQISMALFSLFVFIENILLIMEYSFPSGITKRRKTHAVVHMTEYISTHIFSEQKLFRDDLQSVEFFAHYSNILDRLESIVDNKEMGAKFHMEYLYSFREYSYRRAPKKDELIKIFNSNLKWFEQLAGMLIMVYGNTYLINQRDVQECMISFDNKHLTSYQMRISRMLENNIRHCFDSVKMQDMWEKTEQVLCQTIREKSMTESQYGDFFERVKNELVWYKEGYVDILEIVTVIRDLVSVKVGNETEYVKMISIYPDKIWQDVNFKSIRERQGKKDVILKYIKQIGEMEFKGNTQAILYNPHRTMSTLKKLMKEIVVSYDQIYEMYRQLKEELHIKEEIEKTEANYIIISKAMYQDLTNIMNDSINEVSHWNNYYPNDDDLIMECRAVLEDLDIVVNINDEERLEEVVFFAYRILLLELLQRTYLYQIVAERYESQNSMSSRELERFKKAKNKESDTYYYSLFNTMVELMDESNQDLIGARNTEQEYSSVNDVSKSVAIMKESIVESYQKERYKYATKLLMGDSNE